jgi:hypothetical protein
MYNALAWIGQFVVALWTGQKLQDCLKDEKRDHDKEQARIEEGL